MEIFLTCSLTAHIIVSSFIRGYFYNSFKQERQINFIEFRELEKLKNKPTQFREHYNREIENQDITFAISLLKRTNVCLNIYNPNKENPLLQSLLKDLYDYYNEPIIIEKFNAEIEIWRRLFSEFYEIRVRTGVDEIQNDNKFAALFKCAESISFYISDISMNQMKNEAEDQLPPEFLVQSYEGLISDLSLIYKYIHFTFKPNFTSKCTSSDIKINKIHFELVQYFRMLSNLFDSWLYFDIAIVEKDGEINFNFNDDIKRISVDSSRYLHKLYTGQFGVMKYAMNNPKISKNNILPPDSFYSEVEFGSYLLLHTNMFVNSLDNVQFYQIPVKQWIRAYAVLVDFGRTQMQKNRDHSPIITKKYKLIDLFVKSGINRYMANTIIDKLTFEPEVSNDLFDSPLIQSGSDYFIFPFIIYNLNAAESLISCLQSHNYDLSKRGFSFEEELKELFISNGINSTDLKHKSNGEEYQCDLAFMIENVVYFLEAKVFFEPFSIRKRYEHLDKLNKAVKQLDRISDFFIHNPQVLEQKLDTCSINEQTQFINIVVTSSTFSGMPVQGKTFMTDFSSLHRFLTRNPPSINILKKTEEGNIEEIRSAIPDTETFFTGKVTNSKLKTFLTDQPVIKYALNLMEEKEKKIDMGNVTLHLKEFVKTTPTFYFEKDEI